MTEIETQKTIDEFLYECTVNHTLPFVTDSPEVAGYYYPGESSIYKHMKVIGVTKEIAQTIAILTEKCNECGAALGLLVPRGKEHLWCFSDRNGNYISRLL